MSPWVTSCFFLFLAWFLFFYTIQSFLSKHGNNSNSLPPGPPGLPVIGHLHMLGDLPHRTFQKLSQKYGPIMGLRLGNVPTIVVSSPVAAELFLKTHDLNFASRPKAQVSDYISYGSRGLGFSEYGPYWRNLRRLCIIHLLNISKVDSYVFLRKEETMRLVENLKGAAERGEAVDISVQVGSVIERITYSVIFGQGYQDINSFKPVIQEMLRMHGEYNLSDYVPFTKAFDLQGLGRGAKNVHRFLDDILEKIIHEHEQYSSGDKEHHMGFIDVLLSLRKTSDAHEEQLDSTTIKALTIDMLGAMMDTSATTIQWVLAELVKQPRVMTKIQEELMTVVGEHRMVEESDLPHLAFLNMTVKETLRLHPVAPLLLPHQSIEDISVEGYHIPKNSLIIVNAWAIGRDNDAWSGNAEEFDPERFRDTKIDVRGQDLKLIPFGSGRRKCPGIELGMRTVQFVLAQLLHCFALALPHGKSPRDVDMTEKNGITVTLANPLLVIPTYRLRLGSI
ncbi:hypothetical protein ACHQM5_006595 [Ranunculus cassubicifolius]